MEASRSRNEEHGGTNGSACKGHLDGMTREIGIKSGVRGVMQARKKRFIMDKVLNSNKCW